MITQPTVLVLGAGASMPYGFPSGRQLYFQIKRDLDTQTRDPNKIYLWGKLLDIGMPPKKIQAFRSALNLANPLSVDAFLEHRDEFLDIGKLAMALSLIPYEDEGRLFNQGNPKDMPDSWYRYLMDKLNVNDCIEFKKNKLSIITFNYDRSLEHYLYTTLKYKFGASDQVCSDALSAIPIIHVHGSLGSLPWHGGRFSRLYKSTDNVQEIQKASQEIVVMSEKQEDAGVFQSAFSLMNEAEKIYFLGFGYHPTNLRRLKLNELARSMNRHGTSIGLRQAEIRALRTDWGIECHDCEVGILDLFRGYVLPN